MRITITGANGFIGSYLTDYLDQHGHDLTLLVRRRFDSPRKQLLWNPPAGEIDRVAVDGQDVIINLAGKNVAADRWNDRVKREIIDSRVVATELIGRTIEASSIKPSVLLNASAVGCYGSHRSSDYITEQTPAGPGFLAESCVKSEAATKIAEDAGVRVVTLRTGIVLDSDGGAVQRMLPFFRLGLGGKIGSGRQIMSWVALVEIGPIIEHILETQSIYGPVNLTAPNPVSNAEFTRALGKALHRPAILPVPGFVLKLLFGEMAEEALIGGAKVIPQKLLDSRYKFRHTELLPTLKAIFEKSI
ncbi:MAG: TIGR01777 family oxidoreductase [Candidatus Zixiibacteriota bacterium]